MAANPHTGEYRELPSSFTSADLAAAARDLRCDPGDVVVLHGSEAAVGQLTRHARNGATADRRRARRKQQRAARRRNR